jgi:hypothetical protein
VTLKSDLASWEQCLEREADRLWDCTSNNEHLSPQLEVWLIVGRDSATKGFLRPDYARMGFEGKMDNFV